LPFYWLILIFSSIYLHTSKSESGFDKYAPFIYSYFDNLEAMADDVRLFVLFAVLKSSIITKEKTPPLNSEKEKILKAKK